jgi:hypothetical protein
VSGFLHNVRKVYLQGRVGKAVKARLTPYALGTKHVLFNPAASRLKIHAPQYVTPSTDPAEMAIVERIFRAFARMKADQARASSVFLPSSLWQAQLNRSYAHLLDGLKNNDLGRFHLFLANFGAWKTYHGVEANTLIHDNSRSLVRRRYLANVVFMQQFSTWRWFHGGRRPVEALTYPMHGNQSGAFLDGMFIGAGSFFNEIYGSTLSELVADRPRPVVADLGGGYGKLAYFTLRNLPESCFIDFDLPETLCLASYFLMKSWPLKRILLYGEDEYSPAAHDRYDAIFMPSFEIEKLAARSVDLFLNKNSLGEMTAESVRAYIAHIARAAHYFFHMNHDLYPNLYEGDVPGLLAHEYPVPADQFKLLFRYPDIGHLLGFGGIDYTMDIFMYLYERRVPATA